MKPPPFDYRCPGDVGEALAALAESGPDGKVLAGGQSLIPLLNMRLAAPARLVDINRLAGLDTVQVTAAGVRVGALARHARVERDAAAAAAQPLLGQALRHVAHPVIRNRGTVVGSLAHADPAAELPAVLAVLGGSVRAERMAGGSAGGRDIAADAFFTGPLESALAPGELATSAFFPALPPQTGTAFAEVSRRHGDYALAGVAAVVGLDDDLRVRAARAAYLGVAATPLVLDLTGPALEAQAGRPAAECDWAGVGRYAAARLDPEPDLHAGAEYRRHLAGVLTERALRAAAREAVPEDGTP